MQTPAKNFNTIWHTSVASLALFAGMLLLLDVGRPIGLRGRTADPDGAQAGTRECAVLAQAGLLVAFFFSGAVNVIIDLEYPHLGLIRVDSFDQALRTFGPG